MGRESDFQRWYVKVIFSNPVTGYSLATEAGD
jgi:hypothetical protein